MEKFITFYSCFLAESCSPPFWNDSCVKGRKGVQTVTNDATRDCYSLCEPGWVITAVDELAWRIHFADKIPTQRYQKEGKKSPNHWQLSQSLRNFCKKLELTTKYLTSWLTWEVDLKYCKFFLAFCVLQYHKTIFLNQWA